MTNFDNDKLFGKNLTVYGDDSKMIKIEKNYVLTLTENQARELYQFLDNERDKLTPDKELKLVYNNLKSIFIDASYRL
jgi:hypothetical protein